MIPITRQDKRRYNNIFLLLWRSVRTINNGGTRWPKGQAVGSTLFF